MTKQPLTVTINLIVILLNALIWLVLGIIIAVNANPGLPDMPEMKGILAVLSIAIAGILMLLTFLLFKHNNIAFYLTLIFFGIAALLTIFDDVGLADVVFVIICLIPIFLLLKDRNWYLQANARTE
jgi:membrane-associated HD superfamily phosphohydrolase